MINRKNETDSFANARLLNSLRKTTEFQTQLLPYLKRQLPKVIDAQKYGDADANFLRETLKDLEMRPDPPIPPFKPRFNPVDIFKRPPAPPFGGDTIMITDRNWNLTVGLIAVSAMSFLVGAFFFRRDLDAAASFGTILKSRFTLFLMDAAIAFPFFGWSIGAENKWWKENSNTSLGWIGPVVLLFYYIHTQYIGPLTFWNQLLQFLVNLPAVTFMYGALFLGVQRRSLLSRFS